jgi:ribosomal protein S27AE
LSSAYLCPNCGSLWAQVAIDDARWSPVVRRCAPCGDGHIIHPWQRNLSHYPFPVLLHSALLALKELS